MSPEPIEFPTYRALDFLVRYGGALAVVLGLCPLAAGTWAWAAGLSVLYALVGLVGGGLVFLLMRSYVELVRVIVDMLLPK